MSDMPNSLVAAQISFSSAFSMIHPQSLHCMAIRFLTGIAASASAASRLAGATLILHGHFGRFPLWEHGSGAISGTSMRGSRVLENHGDSCKDETLPQIDGDPKTALRVTSIDVDEVS